MQLTVSGAVTVDAEDQQAAKAGQTKPLEATPHPRPISPHANRIAVIPWIMRLLHVKDLTLTEFREESKRPKYVIASHRWGRDEATFRDVQGRTNQATAGYQKVEAFTKYVRENVSSIEWLWIDTCCIDKDSAAELSYAINSMFVWYRDAELCIAYLADVEAVEGSPCRIAESEWFERGWTLQELLAPRIVVFVTADWTVIGSKGSFFHSYSATVLGSDLSKNIAEITGLPEDVLNDYAKSINIEVEEKMKWMYRRKTTLKEDRFYALFGIVGVTPGVNYGEGHEGAKRRLRGAITERNKLSEQRVNERKEISNWLSAHDPLQDHERARSQHEPTTGLWFLDSSEYQTWKYEQIRTHLWVYGKAGCGKTVLCSTAFEDVRIHCQTRPKIGHAIFYFRFSENQTQSFDALIRSLVYQLGLTEPCLPILLQAREKSYPKVLGRDELQKILLSCTRSYDAVFLHLDALDECSESSGLRESVLDHIRKFLHQADNVRVIITSRDTPDIRKFAENIGSASMAVAERAIDTDIQQYISTRLTERGKLPQLSLEMRTLIADTLSRKANGMFRWVHLQLEEVLKTKSTKPSAIMKALACLPLTLDETYSRILTSIDKDDQSVAFTLLRWLAYAQSPLSLCELAEVTIIDPTDDPAADGTVDIDDRGGWTDTLGLLAGLVTTNVGERDPSWLEVSEESTTSDEAINQDTKVILAHFSVKEYLESTRIFQSNTRAFHLDPGREHRFIAQSCLVYLTHYSRSLQKTSTMQDLSTFPLLLYAAESWYYHSALQQSSTNTREILFLACNDSRLDWLQIHQPDTYIYPFSLYRRNGHKNDRLGSDLYYASFMGLEKCVELLLARSVDINAEGGFYGHALAAASGRGHKDIVGLLLEHGADINARIKFVGTALTIASEKDNRDIVKLLLDHGADVNVKDGYHGTALTKASEQGHGEIVQLLIEHGADVNARDGYYGSALMKASAGGHGGVVKLLLEHGADTNANGSFHGNALTAASAQGDGDIVKLLLEHGIKVNAGGGVYGGALQAASEEGYGDIVKLLLEHGADVNADGGFYGNALQAASSNAYVDVAKCLVENGANVNAQGGGYGNALQAASSSSHKRSRNPKSNWSSRRRVLNDNTEEGRLEIVKLLLEKGADINAPGKYGSALCAASRDGYTAIARLLLGNGAALDAESTDQGLGNALSLASYNGRVQVVKLLVESGANVNARERKYGNALQAASVGCRSALRNMELEYSDGTEELEDSNDTDNDVEMTKQDIRKSYIEVVKILLENGADADSDGRSHGYAVPATTGDDGAAAAADAADELVKLLSDARASIAAG